MKRGPEEDANVRIGTNTPKNDPDGTQDVVSAAVSAWRHAESSLPADRLSAGARANIRVLARRRVSDDPADRVYQRPLARLFLPAGRFAAVAAIPALILAFSFGWLLNSGSGPQDRLEASVSIETSKIDGQAVFDIANGGRVHRVYKSTSAKDIGRADLFATVEDGFRDTLTGDETLVFYRID